MAMLPVSTARSSQMSRLAISNCSRAAFGDVACIRVIHCATARFPETGSSPGGKITASSA
jgi:hypothetical protein